VCDVHRELLSAGGGLMEEWNMAIAGRHQHHQPALQPPLYRNMITSCRH